MATARKNEVRDKEGGTDLSNKNFKIVTKRLSKHEESVKET